MPNRILYVIISLQSVLLLAALIALAPVYGWRDSSAPLTSQSKLDPDVIGVGDPQHECQPCAGDTNTDRPSCEASYKQLSQELDAALTKLAWAEARATSAIGEPITWPDSVPDEYTEAGVRRTIREIEENAPQVAGLATHVDCDEFPCLVFAEVREGSMSSPLFDSEGWSFRNPDYFAETRSDDGSFVRYAVVTAEPPDWNWTPEAYANLQLRLRYRRDYTKQILEEEWSE